MTGDQTASQSVSAIVPFFGNPVALVRALESVAGQTRPVAEVIVVDDAHPSGPDVTASFYGRNWPFRLRTVRHERNVGPGEARNTGWSVSDPTCEFLAFLDADDTWHPRKISVQTSWMLANPAFSWSAHRCGGSHARAATSGIRFHELAPNELLLSNPVATPTVMIRRDVRQRFRQGWRYCEDLMLWLDLISSGQRGALLHISLATLGRRPKSPGGLTSELEHMHAGELHVIDAMQSEYRLSPFAAAAWRSWLRLKYLTRRVRRQ